MAVATVKVDEPKVMSLEPAKETDLALAAVNVNVLAEFAAATFVALIFALADCTPVTATEVASLAETVVVELPTETFKAVAFLPKLLLTVTVVEESTTDTEVKASL
jgi:hypothetical protein